MLIKINLGGDQFHEIEKLVENNKYEDEVQFIKLAITNQLQEEKAGNGEIELANDFAKTQSIPKNMSFSKIVEPASEINFEAFAKQLSDFKGQKSQIEKYEDGLIWSFYNRFLPVKIVINQLAKMVTSEEPWVNLEKLRNSSLDIPEP